MNRIASTTRIARYLPSFHINYHPKKRCTYSSIPHGLDRFRTKIWRSLPLASFFGGGGSKFHRLISKQHTYHQICHEYHASRTIQEKISTQIVFLRPTFILRRLYLQRIPNIDMKTAKNFDNYYECNVQLFDDDLRLYYKKQWWTARFKCPLTGEVFGAMKFHEDDYIKVLQNIGGTNEKSDIYFTREKDQTIYYGKKYVAKEAVAASVLNSLVARGHLDQNGLGRFCIEDPYRGQGDESLLSLPRIISPRFGTLKSLLHFLYFYTESCPSSLKNFDSYFEYETVENNGPWFTASFTSPLSGETFHSGSFHRILMNESEKTKFLMNQTINGRVYYQNRIDAEEAAVARALDCFVMRGTVNDIKNEASSLLHGDDFNQNVQCVEMVGSATMSESTSVTMSESTSLHAHSVDLIRGDLITRQSRKESSSDPSLSNTVLNRSLILSDESWPKTSNLNESNAMVASDDASTQLSSYGMNLMLPSSLISRLYVLSRTLPLDQKTVDDSYEYIERRFPDFLAHPWYSAAFTCPISKEKYEALVLKEFYTDLSENDEIAYMTKENGGKIYYAKKAFSKEAAAARALNEFVNQGKLGKYALERFCEELPLPLGGDNVSLKFSDHQKFSHLKLAYLILSELYTRNYPNLMQQFDGCFTHSAELFPTSSKPNVSNEWWTSSFTCPVTGETFDAGTLHILDVGAGRTDRAFCRTANGKTYYKKRNDSKEAAAARALDCFIIRGCLDKHLTQRSHNEVSDATEVRFEQQPPSTRGMLTVDHDLVLTLNEYIDPDQRQIVDSNLLLDRATKINRLDSNFVDDQSADTDHPESTIQLCPKIILQNYFAEMRMDNSMLSTRLCYNSFLMKTPFHVLDPTIYDYWASSFTDPITGEVFTSGTLFDIESKDTVLKEEGILSPPLHFTADDKVYYRQKKVAEQAAAGRAVDSYNARRKFDLSHKVPRFCREPPVIEPSVISSNQTSMTLGEIDQLVLDESSDEFVILNVPGASNFDTLTSRSTMDRILEAWADASSMRIPSQVNITNMNLKQTAPSYLTAASNALTWFERITTAHGKQASLDTASNLHIPSISSVNAVLNALGEANQYPINRDSKLFHMGEIIDIETTAKQILDRLIAATKTEGSSFSPTTPNVETFNAYISCLRHQFASLEAAMKAEALLMAMLNQGDFQGFKLPLPNEDTFNLVLKIWGSVPNLGRNKINEILKLMETHDLVKPTRNTFLLYLSSLPILELSSENVLNENYLEAAASVIERMKTYEKLFGDEYLVNCEVYNAPLPSGAGYNLQRDYENGFVPYLGTHDLRNVRMAENVDRWIHDMERLAHDSNQINAAPNARTYESAIFTWTRTGTRHGLEQAETWAKRAIEIASTDSDLTPGTQLFYPIIVAWAFSGDEHSPKKVNEWIEKLLEVQSTQPNMKIDTRIREAEVFAWKNYHRSLMKKCANHETQDLAVVETIVDVARKCSTCLKETYQEPLDPSESETTDWKGLQAAVDVWSDTCILLASLHMKDSWKGKDISCSLEHALEQLFSLLAIADKLSDTALNQCDEIKNQDSQQFHLQSILIPSINIYLSALQTFRKLSSSGVSSSSLYNYFPDIERITRRVMEFILVIDSKPPLRATVCLPYHYDPLFHPIIADNIQAPSAYAEHLLDDVLALCENAIPPSYVTGDVMRVIIFLLSQTQCSDSTDDSSHSSDTDTTSIYLRLIPLINRFVENEHEKAILLHRLYNANKSSPSVRNAIVDACPTVHGMVEQDDHISTSGDDRSIRERHISRKKRVKFLRKRSYS